ncbi:dethiobiotin synthase [Megasphaera hutchinsoni]|jgi:hypothetical protein|uniref:ATP-dependent dethiobiotin synthetase BioD n=1 Tax=Megasphaera hutchinsoni TaxID=1588748 RepID=A0A2J8B8U4_9FIRM|nr:dethiobiotin synthase [Megasphaera genomosp. type_2]MUP59714.1 dethiobiotin synthase [Veillonellaceae bacterium M2-4]PNH21167.1 dethiobiotin synthase [Megasphaera genomosp. type_2]
MSNGLFITGTGTDVGKTYITALLIKTLRQANYNVGYYKAAISGAASLYESDAGYVNRIAQINEPESMLVPYLFQHAVSPHLASKLENRPIEKEIILTGWRQVLSTYPYVTVEGSGGIICPIRHDSTQSYYLADIIRWLHIPSIIVGTIGLGSINAFVLTAHYMKSYNLPVKGFIANCYHDTLMENDNIALIQELTQLPLIAKVPENAQLLDADITKLAALYEGV